jgi:hypothetical protein
MCRKLADTRYTTTPTRYNTIRYDTIRYDTIRYDTRNNKQRERTTSNQEGFYSKPIRGFADVIHNGGKRHTTVSGIFSRVIHAMEENRERDNLTQHTQRDTTERSVVREHNPTSYFLLPVVVVVAVVCLLPSHHIYATLVGSVCVGV